MTSLREDVRLRLRQEESIPAPDALADDIWERLVRPVLLDQAVEAADLREAGRRRERGDALMVALNVRWRSVRLPGAVPYRDVH
ncbi:hypothetical protein ACFY3O_27630 [Streptomyces sp. NPDC001046]|uniref:hypothetical protein n=1 Tax=Streptomyces sp. NPDC001046 TaxID=3364543 RepID=UPI00367629C7